MPLLEGLPATGGEVSGLGKQTYTNPIVPGFAPDPSVVFVDGIYFLVTSSFHIFPGIPIYASEDLKAWTHIGNAINRVEQIDLTTTTTKAVPLVPDGTMIGAGGLFAPTIRHHRGTFYIVCTNVAEEGDDFDASNFYITTTDIWGGQWSNPRPLEFRGIDPSLFIDDDGRAYIQGAWRLAQKEQPYSTIKQYEIDLQTGERLSAIRELWPGAARIYTEAPHVYRKDGYYYLVVAEGGTFEHHMASIARSRDIWGPYESCPQNPILTSDGKPTEFVRDAGHIELFQDAHGSWWATLLGVRKVKDRYPLGREAFLTLVDWPTDDWPRIQHPQLQFDRHSVSTSPSPRSIQASRRIGDCYIRTPDLTRYHWSGDVLRLSPSVETLAVAPGTASFVGRRQRSTTSVATVAVRLREENLGNGALAGLAVYKDDFRSAFIALDLRRARIIFGQRRLIDAEHAGDEILAECETILQPGGSVSFRIECKPAAYEFSYRQGRVDPWQTLGTIDSLAMTCRDFTGPILGVFAHAMSNGAVGQAITFESFAVDG